MQRLEIRPVRVAAFALCAISLASCARSVGVARPPVLAPLTVAQQAADGKIASAVATANASGDVLVSPFGVRELFGMLAMGARGDTLRGIDDTLAIDPAAPAFLPPSVSGLMSGNSIWLDRVYRPDPEFVSSVERTYGADVNVRDFGSPVTSGEIGRWVARYTKGRVALIPLIGLEAIAANAFSYDVHWANPFPRSETEPDVFHATGGDERIPLMHEVDRLGYSEDAGSRYVRLPFTDGNAMVVALPKHGIGVATLTGAMAKADMPFNTADIRLTLPRFAAQSSVDLTNILSGLGMANAFSGSADFAPIFGRARIGFSLAYQRCAIEDARSHAIIMAGIIRRI